MKFKTLVHHLKKVEKIILVFLVLILLGSGFRIAQAFYQENTEPVFVSGGIYTEGAVGEVSTLNPLFVQQGSIAQDLTELIFSGLTKYDTTTGQIIPDLATFKKSEDGKTYDFILKDGVKWHDGKLLTADDIIFTYESVIKNPDFKGAILNYNDYSGVKIKKIDERTIQFLLDKPDAYFLAKTTVGILPKHLLEKENISQLGSSAFNLNPIGTGPYHFTSVTPFPNYSDYNLEVFDDYYDKKPNIKTVILEVFPNFQELEKNLNQLSGIRNISEEFSKTLDEKSKFILDSYQLPQYVAVFINNEGLKTRETNVRLALQLGTNKQAIVDQINQHKIIDTPLLEIDQNSWLNKYSVKKANGALFETEWQVPNKDALNGQDLVEIEKTPGPTSKVSYIETPNGGKDWKTSQEPITLSGKVPDGTQAVWIGDYKLQFFKPGDKTWSYIAAKKFDSLKSGKNVYEVFAENAQGKKTLLDAITIDFEDEKVTMDSDDKERVEQENNEAIDLPVRENKKGEKLSLKLLTSQNPPVYGEIAKALQVQWKKIGVDLQIEILPSPSFEEKLAQRDYDLLLFGQSLGYNLDAYPYWHSSQAKKEDETSTQGLNLSQFKNFVADNLFEKARLDDDKARQETLQEVQEIISQEVPAIFLYSPTYYTALSKDINYPEFKHLATTSDRLATIQQWYAASSRKFKDGVNIFTLFTWAAKQL